MDIKVDLENKFTAALQAFQKSRGGSYGMERVVNKAMQFLVSFSIPKIPRAEKAAILRKYMQVVKQTDRVASPVYKKMRQRQRAAEMAGKKAPRGKAVRKYELIYSLAAFKVWRTNYKGAKSLTGDAFYALVGKYISARQFAAGYHRSGLLPALNVFRRVGGLSERLPRYKRLPGRARAADKKQTIPEAEVADSARAIAMIAPNAFRDAAPETIRQLEKFALENLNQRLAAARLK